MTTLQRWLLASALTVPLLIVHRGTFDQLELEPSTSHIAAMSEVRQVILDRWVEEPDPDELRDAALGGMVASLDRFSAYIKPQKRNEFEERTSGQFGGLGMYLELDAEGRCVVTTPLPNTPAWTAGLKPGDVISTFDGAPSPVFQDTSEAVALLKGAPDTEIVLTVLRPRTGEELSFTLTRAVINRETVQGTRLLPRGVGYLRIVAFSTGTLDQFHTALRELREAGELKGLIVDLRGNPGGYLRSAVDIADAFLEPDALVVTTRARGGVTEQRLAAAEAKSIAVPCALLIDGGSASASEVLAGALVDNEVAAAVGTRSYGKGSVQSIIDVLGGEARVKLTTQYFFTPKGRRIHQGRLPDDDDAWGILPSIRVEVSAERARRVATEERERELERLKARAWGEPYTGEERLHLDDPQVEAAFQHMRAVIAGTERLGAEHEVAVAPLPESDGVAPVDSTSAAPVDSE